MTRKTIVAKKEQINGHATEQNKIYILRQSQIIAF